MNVSTNVKKQYHSTSVHKNLLLYFPELDLEIKNQQIYEESMYLRESIFEKKSIEFVGCIASVFMIDVNGLQNDIKGKVITVSITTDESVDEPITLFNGIVDSAVRQDNKRIKKITAYDCLYTKGNTEVAAWYKSLKFPITLKDMRDSLFHYIGLEQVETSLPNDGVTIKKWYDPNTLQALAVIKAICQINGAFGIINREGEFEYRILGEIKQAAYPSVTLFPSNNLFPADPDVAARMADEINAEYFSFYRRVDYEEFEVKVIDKVTVRQSEDDQGVTYGSGTNNYIVQGNIFAYGLSKQELTAIAKNIYNSIGGFSYYPFQSENNGLPFIECGIDAVSYYVVDWEKTMNGQKNRSGGLDIVYEQRPFYVLNRELSGIQALKDSYSAKGEEYQSEFVTDLQTQIDLIKKNQGADKSYVENYVGNYTYDKGTIDDMFANFDPGTGGGFNVESVAALPSNPDPNTIYLIQGVVVVE
jgi:hypothetical protein